MIWKPSYLTRKQMEERRRTGGRLLRQGKLSQAEIARQLGVTRMAVSHWAKQLLQGGMRQLRRRKSTGCPPKLTPAQQKAMLRLLKRGAKAAGFRTERWTLQRIQKVIAREFHVVYHPNYVSHLLQKLDGSLQVPLPRAKERNEKLIRAWRVHDWPRIKKKARRIGATVVFFDEFGFSFQEMLARMWSPKGKRPLLYRVEGERRAVSTAVGFTWSGKIYQRHFGGSMKSEQVLQSLQHVHRHVPGLLILIWDRASIHRSRKTQAYLDAHPEIMIEPLPPYAPELNPEEYCHGNVKQHLRNSAPDTVAEMCGLLDREFARLRRRPDMLLNFIHHAGLSVKQLF